MTTTLDIQRRLAALGFNPGPIDGIPGPMTRAAVMAFQKAGGLTVDGIVGPITTEALFEAESAPAISLPWMDAARHYLGLHEVANARTLDKALKLDASAIPWCGAFVAMCITGALPDEPIPSNPLGARNWLKFGSSCDAEYGAVAVFWRGSKSGWAGHVGFVAGHDRNYVHVLGGNQSNKVSIAKVSKARLLGYRRPASVKLGGELPWTTISATVTTNEA